MIIIATIILSLVVAVIYVTELQARREARRQAVRDNIRAQLERARQPCSGARATGYERICSREVNAFLKRSSSAFNRTRYGDDDERLRKDAPRCDGVIHEGMEWLDSMVREVESADTKRQR